MESQPLLASLWPVGGARAGAVAAAPAGQGECSRGVPSHRQNLKVHTRSVTKYDSSHFHHPPPPVNVHACVCGERVRVCVYVDVCVYMDVCVCEQRGLKEYKSLKSLYSYTLHAMQCKTFKCLAKMMTMTEWQWCVIQCNTGQKLWEKNKAIQNRWKQSWNRKDQKRQYQCSQYYSCWST